METLTTNSTITIPAEMWKNQLMKVDALKSENEALVIELEQMRSNPKYEELLVDMLHMTRQGNIMADEIDELHKVACQAAGTECHRNSLVTEWYNLVGQESDPYFIVPKQKGGRK